MDIEYYVISMGSEKFTFISFDGAVTAFCMLMSALGVDINSSDVMTALLEESSFTADSCCIKKEDYSMPDPELYSGFRVDFCDYIAALKGSVGIMYYYYIKKMDCEYFRFREITDAVAAFCMLTSAFGIDIGPFEVYITLLKESSFEVSKSLLEESSFSGSSCCIMKEPYEKEDLEELISRYMDKTRDIQHRIFCGV